jgi:macrodomain Ter protein organizer (MatP/YcbG family)
MLRDRREKRFDDLARQIDTYRTQGLFKECEEAMQELLRIFHDPESVEYHVVRSFHESLLEEMAEAERAAQERH